MATSPWLQYQQTAPPSGGAMPWEKYANPTPAPVVLPPAPTFTSRLKDVTNSAQNEIDDLTRIKPFDPAHPVDTTLGNVGAGLMSPLSLLAHPRASAEAMRPHGTAETLMNLLGPEALPALHMGEQLVHNPAGTAEQGLGMIAGAGLSDLVPEAAGSLRDAAVGDPDSAALRGLRVGPSSPKSLRTISAVQGARPYLQGVKSLEDLQAKIPSAKAEIWGPYEKTIGAIGNKPVMGPDGPTTVSALENERLAISANLRALKQGGPEAIQLAAQKGMNSADLLAREKAVQSALDPHLEEAGISPKEIRKTFGQVSEVGGRVSGKSTLAEKPAPFGFGKIANLSFEHPFQAPAQIASGLRDLFAGRPMWSGSPTDVALREAFRTGGPKPDFGDLRPMPYPVQPLQLEANVPGNSPYGPEPDAGSMNGIPERNPIRITPPPLPRNLALPASSLAGEARPMIRYARPYVEPFDPRFQPVDLAEWAKQFRNH